MQGQKPMVAKKDKTQKPLQVVSPLHKALRQLSEHLTRKMREIGAPEKESHLLSFVEVYGPCRVGELRRVFGFQPSTLTSLLDRLESEGLVTRRTDPDDRRSFLIEATAEGRLLGRRVRRVVEEFESEILEGIGGKDLEGFRAVMEAVAEVTQVKLREEVENE
ncbi:MAG: MarR family winged helix-turn-helix transcriptional regulator [Thermoanaerobaculia bacterium]